VPRHRAHRVGKFHLLRGHRGPGQRPHQQILRRHAGKPLLRWQRVHRRDRKPLSLTRPNRIPPRRPILGRQCAALLRLPGQLRRLHGGAQPSRPHHGAGSALRWPPHPRLLHLRREKDLRHLNLLRESPLQGELHHGVHRLRQIGGEGVGL